MDGARRILSQDVQNQSYEWFLTLGMPESVDPTTDSGSGFTVTAAKIDLKDLDATTLHIEPGTPWETGQVPSYLGKFWDELLKGEALDALMEAQILIEVLAARMRSLKTAQFFRL